MADEELRRLERLAGAGDLEAEARLLRERLRIGDASRDGVEIAAYLGHAAAGRVVPHVAPADLASQEWITGLGRWGKATLVRAALLAGRAVLSRFEQTLTHEQAPREALRAAEEWLVHPCEAHRVAARLAMEAADDCAREAAVIPEADDDMAFAAYAARDAARAAAAHDLAHAAYQAAQAFDSAGAVEVPEDPSVVVRRALIEWGLRQT